MESGDYLDGSLTTGGRPTELIEPEIIIANKSSTPQEYRGLEKHVLGGYEIVKRVGRGADKSAWEAIGPDGNRYALLIPRFTGEACANKFDAAISRNRRGVIAGVRNLATTVATGNKGYAKPVEGGDWVHVETYAIFPLHTTLAEHVRENGPMSDFEACRVIGHVAQGILDLYSKLGMYATDVKPANIFYREAGAVLLGDVGGRLDRRREIGTLDSRSDEDTGRTVIWAAPEVLKGQPSTMRALVFSLGQIGYFMMTGELPYGSSEQSDNFRDVEKWRAFDRARRTKRTKRHLDIEHLLRALKIPITKPAARKPSHRKPDWKGRQVEAMRRVRGHGHTLYVPARGRPI